MLHLDSLVIKSDRVVAVVRMDADAPWYTTPDLMERVAAAFPDVPGHACVNARGPHFSDVMDRTSIPHLLEHLVIDLQADAYTQENGAARCPQDAPLLLGVTKWVDRAQGLAQVQVAYFDDLVALAAFRDAAAFLNTLA